MLVTIPFSTKDHKQAVLLLEWINELSDCKAYPCLLVADCDLSEPDVDAVRKAARKCFKSVRLITLPYNIKRRQDGDTGWPLGPNWMFFCTLFHIAMTEDLPWLWLESDCVPLAEDWLDRIHAEYLKQGKPFLGPVIETQNKSFQARYLNGTAVYPANALRYFHDPLKQFLNGAMEAFDMAGSPNTVPQAHFSSLIQHGFTDSQGINHWGTHPNPPLIFKEIKESGDNDSVLTPASIRPETVLFHPCKNSSLIDLLRKRREQEKVAA